MKIAVSNLPTTQPISGNVAVSNFPPAATEVAITNFPANQALSGSISVSNFPAAAVTARITSYINTTTNGTIAAGTNSIAIANIGSAAGSVKGVSLPSGASISWSANGNDILDAASYVATGTNFLITTVV